jgi:hypothetical protein
LRGFFFACMRSSCFWLNSGIFFGAMASRDLDAMAGRDLDAISSRDGAAAGLSKLPA